MIANGCRRFISIRFALAHIVFTSSFTVAAIVWNYSNRIFAIFYDKIVSPLKSFRCMVDWMDTESLSSVSAWKF